MGALPVVPVQDMVRMGWPRPIIDYFVRLRQLSLDVADGDIILPNGNSAVYTDANGNLSEMTGVSDTELGYLNGVTSAIQGQFNSKLPISTAGGSQYWDDILFNLAASRTIGAGVPSWTDINSTGRYGWAFTDEAVEANEKRTDWGTQNRHGIVANSGLRFHVHLYTGARVPAVNEYVYFELIYGVTNRDAVLSTTTLTKQVLIPSGTAAYTHLKVSHADWTVASTITASADMGGTIRRKSSSASDTYADTVYLVHLDAHALFDRGGTANEYT